mgnify:CR=1 FL=1
MADIRYCYIVEQYYQEHPNLVKILDEAGEKFNYINKSTYRK